MIYESLSSIYLFLPPLFAVLFVIFINAIKNDDTVTLLAASLALILFEAQKDYILFSSIVYFTFIYRFLVLKLDKYIQCVNCVKFLLVLIAYIGYYLFALVLSQMFLLNPPDLNLYVIYYIIIEFVIILIFQDWNSKGIWLEA
ncbi:hypothetical protein [Sulfurimonas sp. HSL-1716]|uniref:hypothetical protein n=1 Tax=Hydrocurvibacter sulfurireducens TaxID=3131937 RepID=UPI0031F9A06A